MRLALAAAACLCLAGCQTINTAPIDAAVANNLPKVCSGARVAHRTFTAARLVVKVSDKTVAREAAAWASLEPLCEDPASHGAADVLVAAVTAYATITKALAETDR